MTDAIDWENGVVRPHKCDFRQNEGDVEGCKSCIHCGVPEGWATRPVLQTTINSLYGPIQILDAKAHLEGNWQGWYDVAEPVPGHALLSLTAIIRLPGYTIFPPIKEIELFGLKWLVVAYGPAMYFETPRSKHRLDTNVFEVQLITQ